MVLEFRKIENKITIGGHVILIEEEKGIVNRYAAGQKLQRTSMHK